VFSNVRLMLLSGIGKPYDPQTSTGVVGRNYAYQTNGNVTAFFEDRYSTSSWARRAVDDDRRFRRRTTSTTRDWASSAAAGSARRAQARGRSISTPSLGHAALGGEWKRRSRATTTALSASPPTAPARATAANYLDLDRPNRDAYGLPLLRMTFDFRPNEYKMSDHITKRPRRSPRRQVRAG